MIDLKPPRPAALHAAPAVALEHGAAYGFPAVTIQADVVSAHVLVYNI